MYALVYFLTPSILKNLIGCKCCLLDKEMDQRQKKERGEICFVFHICFIRRYQN